MKKKALQSTFPGKKKHCEKSTKKHFYFLKTLSMRIAILMS